MNLKPAFACLALIAAAALAGCGPSNGNGQHGNTAAGNGANTGQSSAVATVNGDAISENTLTTFVSKRTGGAHIKLSPADKTNLLNQLINLKVLAQKADQEGIAAKPDMQAEINIQREALLANALVRQYIDQHPVTDDDVKQAYAKRVGSMDRQEYKARHILVNDKKSAEDAISKLNGGADFAKLAEKVSTGPSAKKGGELGWFSPSDMVQPFSQAVEKLKKGQYTKEPVKTQFGWHVILLEDVRDVPKPTLADLKPAIENQLRGQQVQDYVKKLRDQAKVDIKLPQQPAPAATPQPATGSQPPTGA